MIININSGAGSKLLSNTVLEHTGLVIGAKSIKNYSRYVFDHNDAESKRENPSLATLDTFARYILDAPYTSEVQRKEKESHYPYWYRYQSMFGSELPKGKFPLSQLRMVFIILIILIMGGGVIYLLNIILNNADDSFSDDFNSVSQDSLAGRGWIIKYTEPYYWNKRNEKQGHLTLYTLKGDNWNLESNKVKIQNLLMREIGYDCFTTEIHFTDFIPLHNWQQAGIILSEDSALPVK